MGRRFLKDLAPRSSLAQVTLGEELTRAPWLGRCTEPAARPPELYPLGSAPSTESEQTRHLWSQGAPLEEKRLLRPGGWAEHVPGSYEHRPCCCSTAHASALLRGLLGFRGEGQKIFCDRDVIARGPGTQRPGGRWSQAEL